MKCVLTSSIFTLSLIYITWSWSLAVVCSFAAAFLSLKKQRNLGKIAGADYQQNKTFGNIIM